MIDLFLVYQLGTASGTEREVPGAEIVERMRTPLSSFVQIRTLFSGFCIALLSVSRVEETRRQSRFIDDFP